MVASPIVMFLEGEGTDAHGRTVFEVVAMDDIALDRTHDFIQWLFPLPEPSTAVPDTDVAAAVIACGTIVKTIGAFFSRCSAAVGIWRDRHRAFCVCNSANRWMR